MGKEQYKLVGRKVEDKRDKNDFYPTPEYVTEALLFYQNFEGEIWECACGDGKMSEVLKKYGYKVISTDLHNRGYFDQSPKNIDFLFEMRKMPNIVTNPPFSLAFEFIEHGLFLADKKLALLLPIRYLCGKKRAELYRRFPPSLVVVIPNKVDFVGNKNPVMEFAWFVWDKQKQEKETKIVWAECNSEPR